MADYITIGVITNVGDGETYYTINFTDGDGCQSGFGLDKKYNVEPKIGDRFELTSVGGPFGTIRGLSVNDEICFYKTDEMLENERQALIEAHKKQELEAFERNKASLDARYDKLPQIFKDRINRFRNSDPDFRVKFESYELYCCEEAVVIAKALKSSEKVDYFYNAGLIGQKLLVPDLNDGHSGNTFRGACSLAYQYLIELEKK